MLMHQSASKLTCADTQVRLHPYSYLPPNFAHCSTQENEIIIETCDYTITVLCKDIIISLFLKNRDKLDHRSCTNRMYTTMCLLLLKNPNLINRLF